MTSGPLEAYPIGTEEYLRARISADVTLDDQPVALSFDRTAWIECVWLGDPGLERVARTVEPVLFTAGRRKRKIWAKVTDTPEVPIILVGEIEVS